MTITTDTITLDSMKRALRQYGGDWQEVTADGCFPGLHLAYTHWMWQRPDGWYYQHADSQHITEPVDTLGDVRRIAQLTGTCGDTAVSIARNHMAVILLVLESLEEQDELDSEPARLIARRLQRLAEDLHPPMCTECGQYPPSRGYGNTMQMCGHCLTDIYGPKEHAGFDDSDVPY